MKIFLFVIFFGILVNGQGTQTPEVEYYDCSETREDRDIERCGPPLDREGTGTCQDGKISIYSEECDGTKGCGDDCFCMKGYKANTDFHICEMECVYAEACKYKCTEPNKCEICSSSRYTDDCQNCQEGHRWFGDGNCVDISDKKIYPNHI